ncbi:putative gypsy-type retrotransposon [Panicum miliaceum]|uniref:Gypsy-type retrotransposon n=1 Tax=Panicum miliaceum TaxID=4540 RepID=A0A3L6RJL0_PANMI|nr:putative gypsy-type retrotransposon [Panicum miliaceum]
MYIHLCEGFLGIAPHFNLWRALYHLRAYSSKGTHDVVGGVAFSLRQSGKYLEVLLAELQNLKAEKLTRAVVELSFAKRLTQPI